jgi:GNAT superfamily N-acetyltransferase
MAKHQVRALDTEDLDGAARLLARRHRDHRAVHPELPARFEDPEVARAEIDATWRSDGASGAVALRDGEVTGYLLGAPKRTEVWGPNIWVEAAGQAATEPETMRDLYAVAAARWVGGGRRAQYVLTPAHDNALVDAWFRLGFGAQHAHAVRPPREQAPTIPDGVTVRRPVRSDIPALARLDLVLPEHQQQSPVFSAAPVDDLQAMVAEWEDDIDDPSFTPFVAEHAGRVVGSAVGCAVEKSSGHAGLARPDHAALFSFAAVHPEARGHGVGRALGESVLHWAATEGYGTVATDWRVTNLLSSRAWTALGFEMTFLRLHRLIGF